MRPSPLEVARLVEDLPEAAEEEDVRVIWQSPHMRVERIVSYGHASDDDFWYDQTEDEWVMVLLGRAVLEIEGEAQPRSLEPGDAINLPARTKHRVVSTASDTATVWLAIFSGVESA